MKRLHMKVQKAWQPLRVIQGRERREVLKGQELGKESASEGQQKATSPISDFHPEGAWQAAIS